MQGIGNTFLRRELNRLVSREAELAARITHLREILAEAEAEILETQSTLRRIEERVERKGVYRLDV